MMNTYLMQFESLKYQGITETYEENILLEDFYSVKEIIGFFAMMGHSWFENGDFRIFNLGCRKNNEIFRT